MTRVDLDWLGNVTPHSQVESNKRSTFKTILLIAVAYITSKAFLMLLMLLRYFTMAAQQPSPDRLKPVDDDVLVKGDICYYMSVILDYFFGLYTIFLTIKTRSIIRIKSGISTSHAPCPNNTAIDCCWAFLCGSCTVAHMARHTTDYSYNAAACCTENGLKKGTYIDVIQRQEEVRPDGINNV